VTLPPGFEAVRDGRTRLLLRRDARDWLLPLLRAVVAGDCSVYQPRVLSGGRGGTTVVGAGGLEVVVRPYRRGGLPARLLHDTYVGYRPRPFRELAVTEALRQRGAPVVEVHGAAVRWLLPGCYRGWLLTRYVAGAQTFWAWAGGAQAPAARDDVLRRVGATIRRLHACGARHPDLNMNNILICPAAGGAEVLLIDFDRAPTLLGKETADLRRVPAFDTPPRDGGYSGRTVPDLDRLRRSIRKLDPEGRFITATDFEKLCAAYHQDHACA
jgi:3-deoxy-D-manno-octulosonic acid kinase